MSAWTVIWYEGSTGETHVDWVKAANKTEAFDIVCSDFVGEDADDFDLDDIHLLLAIPGHHTAETPTGEKYSDTASNYLLPEEED